MKNINKKILAAITSVAMLTGVAVSMPAYAELDGGQAATDKYYQYKTSDIIRLAKYISGKMSYSDAIAPMTAAYNDSFEIANFAETDEEEQLKPTLDLNGDGIVTSEDLVYMIKILCGEITITTPITEPIIAVTEPTITTKQDKIIIDTATLEDEFEDDSISIIYTMAASMHNRDITAEDFSDIGAVGIKDIVRLSDAEYACVREVWEATENYYAEPNEETMAKLTAAQNRAAMNTLVNIGQYRRIIKVKLDKHSKENVLQLIKQLQKRDDIYWVGVTSTLEVPLL